jgi:hypothetical protein
VRVSDANATIWTCPYRVMPLVPVQSCCGLTSSVSPASGTVLKSCDVVGECSARQCRRSDMLAKRPPHSHYGSAPHHLRKGFERSTYSWTYALSSGRWQGRGSAHGSLTHTRRRFSSLHSENSNSGAQYRPIGRPGKAVSAISAGSAGLYVARRRAMFDQ